MNPERIHAAAARILGAAAVATLAAAAGLAPFASAAAQNEVPGPYRGTWVPTKATCDSPVRMLVAADRLTLQNGKDIEALGGVEMAGPGYFAHDYRGIMAVLLTEFSGDQPAVVTFNLGERKGAAQVEFAPVMPGKGTPQLAKYNAHISKLNLVKRFPLDKVLLKKCSAEPGATGK